MTYVIDTHTLLWFLQNLRLGAKATAALEDGSATIVIPAMVLAEVAYLSSRRRVGPDTNAVLEYVNGTENCIHHPMDVAVVQRLPRGLEMHDGLIVATALSRRDLLGEDVAVVTRDAEITASLLVPVVW